MNGRYRHDDPWRLKLKRAQYHLAEIKNEIQRYAESHPYQVVRAADSSGRRGKVPTYRIRMTRYPDPMLAIIFGEFVHNLRSALDNIIAASVPNKYKYDVSFPISTEDVLMRVTDGWDYRDDEVGQRFKACVVGLDRRAQAIVEKVQPYRTPANSETHSLRMLSRIDNADKHRGAVILGCGIRNANVRVLVRGEEIANAVVGPSRRHLIDDGAEIVRFKSPMGIESEVDVQVRGTACVTVKVSLPGSHAAPEDFRIQSAMWKPITDVRWVLDQLEPFVRR